MEKAFEKSHPFVMALYFLCSIVLVMLLNHPLFLLLAIVAVISTLKLFVSTSALWKSLKGSLLLILVIMFVNILFNQNGTTELIALFGRSIALEVVVYSISMGCMLLIIFQLSFLFNETLNGAKFLFVVSKLAPKTGLVIMLALRYVPLLKTHVQQIMAVQRMKGHSLTEGSFIERVKSGLLILQLLLSISLEDALQTADSMKARGYQLQITRTSYSHYKWGKYDTLSLLYICVVMIVSIATVFSDVGVVEIYPKLAVSWSIEQLMVTTCASMLLAFPLILQSLEWCRWKFYSLKM